MKTIPTIEIISFHKLIFFCDTGCNDPNNLVAKSSMCKTTRKSH